MPANFDAKILTQKLDGHAKTAPFTLTLNNLGLNDHTLSDFLTQLQSHPKCHLISTLDLSGNNIKTSDFRGILDALPKLRGLNTLCLSDNDIQHDGLRELSKASINKAQDLHIDLTNNALNLQGKIGQRAKKGFADIQQSISNCTKATVVITSGNGLSPSEIKNLTPPSASDTHSHASTTSQDTQEKATSAFWEASQSPRKAQPNDESPPSSITKK
jgi:hypothetical protein